MSFLKSFTCRALMSAVVLSLLLTLSLVSLYWQLGLISDKVHSNYANVTVNESEFIEDTIARLNPDGKAIYFSPGRSYHVNHFFHDNILHHHHHHHHHKENKDQEHHRKYSKDKHSHLLRAYGKGESACTNGPLFPVGKSTVITISTEDGERNFVVYIPTSYEVIHRRSVTSADTNEHNDRKEGKHAKKQNTHHHYHHKYRNIPVLSSFSSWSWHWWKRHSVRKTHEYTPAGMLLLFHGINDNCDRFLNATGFIPYAEQDGFIIVSACGSRGYLGVGWNAGECCGFWNEHPNDVMFANAIVEAVSNAVCIDPDRVMAGGFSNGAMMAEVIGCNSPEVFRAVFSVGGVVEMRPGNAAGLEMCSEAIQHDISNTARPSVLMMHGDADYKVPWNGNHWIGFPPMEDNIHGWTERCGCTHDSPSNTINTTEFVNTIYDDCFVEAFQYIPPKTASEEIQKEQQEETNSIDKDFNNEQDKVENVISALPAVIIDHADEESEEKINHVDDKTHTHGQKCKAGTHNCLIRKRSSRAPHSRHEEKEEESLTKIHLHDVHNADKHNHMHKEQEHHKQRDSTPEIHQVAGAHTEDKENGQAKTVRKSDIVKHSEAKKELQKHSGHNEHDDNHKHINSNNNHHKRNGSDNMKNSKVICYLPSANYKYHTHAYWTGIAKGRTDKSNATVEVVRAIGGSHTWPETSDFSTTNYIYNFGLRVFDQY